MPQTIRLEFAKSNTKGKTSKHPKAAGIRRWESFFPLAWETAALEFVLSVKSYGGENGKVFFLEVWREKWTFLKVYEGKIINWSQSRHVTQPEIKNENFLLKELS